MLSVSFSLALVAAMLFGIVFPGHHTEVDKFNGQTREPIPAGTTNLVSGFSPFKAFSKKFIALIIRYSTLAACQFGAAPRSTNLENRRSGAQRKGGGSPRR